MKTKSKGTNGTVSINPQADKRLKEIRTQLKKKTGYDIREIEIVSKMIMDFKVK